MICFCVFNCRWRIPRCLVIIFRIFRSLISGAISTFQWFLSVSWQFHFWKKWISSGFWELNQLAIGTWQSNKIPCNTCGEWLSSETSLRKINTLTQPHYHKKHIMTCELRSANNEGRMVSTWLVSVVWFVFILFFQLLFLPKIPHSDKVKIHLLERNQWTIKKANKNLQQMSSKFQLIRDDETERISKAYTCDDWRVCARCRQ